jgi:DNA-binding SARP family transcriptional activator
VHLGSGIYVPHDDIRLDWAAFSILVRRSRAEHDKGDLRAALELVRGEPFAECFYWWIDVALVETMRAEIVDAADLLAQLELAAGNADAAAWAARAGLTAEPAAEQLWRALMRAEDAAGNAAGVAEAWSACLDAITEIAPGGEPHPDTQRLYRELSRPAQELTFRH